MRVLVLGASGLLGKVLCEEWATDIIFGANSQQADICDCAQLRDLFARSRPKLTILAAAYTDVDGCEKDPKRAYKVNCTGAVNVAQAAREAGSKLFFLSTDYVFDGSKTTPYEPEDTVSPINAYGASKAAAEREIQTIIPGCCIVRTAWLFGAQGRCFPNTILQVARNSGKLAVVDDQKGCPTFNRDLARAIVALARVGSQGIVHVTNRGACTWYEFACALIRKAGLENVKIERVTSSEFPRPARRPASSILSSRSLDHYGIPMRSWQETLEDYFADRETASQVTKT